MKTIDEILKGCEHDGSYIPVSEVKRLMEEYASQFQSQAPLTNDNIKQWAEDYAEENFIFDRELRKEALIIGATAYRDNKIPLKINDSIIN